MGARRPVSVGVIGLGRSGWDLHVRSLRDDPRYRIAAACDPLEGRRRQARRELGCAVYAGHEGLLAHPGLELAVIASKSNDHVPMARGALERGLHVVLEKPLASSAREFSKLQALARKRKRLLSPYYNFRFSRDFLLIQSLLKKGLIGKPFLIKRQVGYFNRREDWQARSDEGGGILNAATVHSIDQVIHLLQERPRLEWFDLRKLISKGDAPDHSKLLLRFPGGCVADIEVSWAQAFSGPEWLIYGTRGALRSLPGVLEATWHRRRDVLRGRPEDRSYLSGERIHWKSLKIPVERGFSTDYYGRLWGALRRGRTPPVPSESALEALRVLDLCRRTR
ncbi:MAG TPA: hypothetical protein DCM05_02660 [Elusimicrobia bacterium]|nr:hypothetical protein [Elusimicrobiota bacterium]